MSKQFSIKIEPFNCGGYVDGPGGKYKVKSCGTPACTRAECKEALAAIYPIDTQNRAEMGSMSADEVLVEAMKISVEIKKWMSSGVPYSETSICSQAHRLSDLVLGLNQLMLAGDSGPDMWRRVREEHEG